VLLDVAVVLQVADPVVTPLPNTCPSTKPVTVPVKPDGVLPAVMLDGVAV
jgi:hypothetical protein